MFDPGVAVRKELAALHQTVHGGQGWKLKDIEDFSHNLNPLGPPEDIAEIMASAAAGVGHYPDDSCSGLKNVISAAYGVRAENITVGAGSSDIIRNFPHTFVSAGETVVIPTPSFAEYSHQCRIAGADVRHMTLEPDNDFRIDRESLSSLIPAAKAVYICNPNNPTGRVEPRNKILDVAKECLDQGTMLFLDETLLELVPNHDEVSCVRYVDEYPNMVVAGSLTKSFAIPGIRIGFGFASADTVAEMDKVRMTWNVGQVEQTVAAVLMGERMDYVEKAARLMAAESSTMNRRLSEVGFSDGNVSDSFFYFRSVEHLGAKASEVNQIMQKNGVSLRDCSSFGSPYEKYVRYSVKDRQRNELFIAAAESAVRALRR
ncbi:MAG: threonine-phosphate decarboxylase [Candidatus Methanomethylophilaceae archaeon]|nr:threonine-phosphate decarboxylase [Candidatus Methanomethylophilaceae archaeon]